MIQILIAIIEDIFKFKLAGMLVVFNGFSGAICSGDFGQYDCKCYKCCCICCHCYVILANTRTKDAPSMVLVRANIPGNKITVFRETTKVQI